REVDHAFVAGTREGWYCGTSPEAGVKRNPAPLAHVLMNQGKAGAGNRNGKTANEKRGTSGHSHSDFSRDEGGGSASAARSRPSSTPRQVGEGLWQASQIDRPDESVMF